jgi:GH43 family beta-xylosidase
VTVRSATSRRPARRPVALLAALAVAAAGLALGPGATTVAAAAEPDVLARYDFTALPDAAAAGTVVPDTSGAGRDATVRGAGASGAGGVLSLPGGSSSSGAAYVELPTGLVDGQDTLTVSAWLRNQKGSGNYAALYLGTTQSPPSQYWLMNPKNPSGRYKSVVTGSVSAGSPWNTEQGLSPTVAANGVAGPVTDDGWSLWTTVIEPGRLTAYLDGEAVGTAAVGRTVADFGTGLVGYVGRSAYADDYWQGQVRELTVHAGALSAQDVAAAYLDGVGDAGVVDAALAADAAALTLPARTAADLVLPAAGSRGSAIAWSTSDAAHLAADGRVTRPADDDVPVVLTATLSAAGRSVTREITVTVVADNPQRNLDLAADGYDLGTTHVHADLVLHDAVGDVAVTWASSDPGVVAADGTVTRGARARAVTLTATFALGGLTTTRDYPVTVLAQDAGRLGTYVAAGGTTRTDVLHLATSDDGTAYTALNNGRGVLYPTLAGSRLGAPEVFRKPDGSYGLVATVRGTPSQVYLFDSADLLTWTGERVVTVAPLAASRVHVAYDNGLPGYRLTVTATDGRTYEVRSPDLATFTAPQEVAAAAAAEAGTFPAGAVETGSTPLTAEELDRVRAKLGRVVATGVTAFADVAVAAGGTVDLPGTATVEYSSGSRTTMAVEWDAGDLAAVDTATPGTYVVDGTVRRTAYADPLIERRADPDVTLGDDGWYWFTASYPMTNASDPEGYDRVVLRRARTIEGLADADEVTIWHEAGDPGANRYVWAPELEKIGDDWYVLFTAARTGGVWDIRPMMLKLTGGPLDEGALDPAAWTSLGQVRAAAGDTDAFTHFSLDMTHLATGGRDYLVWAEKPGASTLRIAEIDPADPTRLLGRSVLLSTPTYAWESWGSESINEGPAVIEHDGKIVLAYSAATVDDKYCVGMLWLPVGADPLDASAWTKNPYPLLTTDDVPGQVGPGHNSFTVDGYGNPVIVFHSRTVGDTSNPGEATDAGLFDPRRHARAATEHWDVDGLPVLNMTAEEELPAALADVQVRVVVAADPVDPVDPVDPTDPTDPVGPTDPVDPAGPAGPVQGPPTAAAPGGTALAVTGASLGGLLVLAGGAIGLGALLRRRARGRLGTD